MDEWSWWNEIHLKSGYVSIATHNIFTQVACLHSNAHFHMGSMSLATHNMLLSWGLVVLTWLVVFSDTNLTSGLW